MSYLTRFVLLFLALLPVAAFAAGSADLAPALDAEEMLGDVAVMVDENDNRCTVALAENKVEQGYELIFFEDGGACAKAFPVMGKVAAWRVYKNHILSFVDSMGQDLIAFQGTGFVRQATKEVDGIAMIHSAQDAAE